MTMTIIMTNTCATFKERSLRLFTFETFDQSGEETRPDQQKDNNKYKDKYIREHLERAIFGTFDL